MKRIKKTNLIKLLKISKNFLMIDEISLDKKNKLANAKKKFNKNVWFYKDHFIDQPIMPGTLQVEAMLQTTVSLLYLIKGKSNNKILINNVSSNFFEKINSPGVLEIKSNIKKMSKGFIEADSEIIFKNKKISDSRFRFIDPSKFKL